MHEDMRQNDPRRGRGGCGFPAVASGMLYGFIREGPGRAAKTMRMILNAKGPLGHEETRSHAAESLPPRATKKHEALRQNMTAMTISAMLWGIIGYPRETFQNRK